MKRKTHGGKRPGAGRKPGSGQKETTVVIRIPERLLPEIKKLIEKNKKK